MIPEGSAANFYMTGVFDPSRKAAGKYCNQNDDLSLDRTFKQQPHMALASLSVVAGLLVPSGQKKAMANLPISLQKPAVVGICGMGVIWAEVT